jgi:transposase InsO family protein
VPDKEIPCRTRRFITPTPGRNTPRSTSPKTLQLHSLNPSTGAVGDAYDNALAQTTIGLYKTNASATTRPFAGPLTSLGSVETLTADSVHWYNTSRRT